MIKRVDENGNIRLITNIRKPRKWRRYEYLLSSGTLYIDTGIKLSLTDKFEFETDFTYSPANNRACPFYGTENYLTGFMAQYHYTNNNLYVVYIKGSQFGAYNVSITASSRMYSKTVIDVPNKTWTTTYNTTSANGTYSNLITDTTSTVKFFGNDLYNKYVAKCYYFKIKINDTLVRDFVPAQYNGQYGMWDLVEDKFYPNKGTGSFTVGPEIKNYDEIDEVRKTSSLLPSGVELYDYILSSGTLWIDSGWIPDYDKGFEVEAKYNFSSSGTRGCIMSTFSASKNISLELVNSSRFYFNGGSWDNSKAVTAETDHISNFKYEGTTVTHTVDGTVAATTILTVTGTSGGSAYLFLDRALRTTAFNKLNKIYYISIKELGLSVRNFLPCTYLGEPGMWDTIENKFYRNQGTGLFTLGNKITLKEYEYLLNSGTLYINTNFIPDYQTTLEVDYLVIGSGYYWGAGRGEQNNGTNAYLGSYANASKQINFEYLGRSYGYINNVGLTLRTKYKCQIIENKYYVSNNNEQIIIDTINTSKICTGNFIIFGINNGSPLTPTFGGSFKLYNFKLYSNFTLVRDFIPISYNGTPGLWDKVEWKFYANAGTGSFTLGPEKASGSIYLHSHLTNLFDGFVAGGLMTLSNGILVGTGNNSDTYFNTKTTQAVNTTSYYLVGVYVEGYTSATTWTFLSPQNNSNAALRITRDGWNWGYVKFGNADSLPIWDDANRAFSGPVPKITISDCRIYKIT